jgi:nicotinamidase-related amidase
VCGPRAGGHGFRRLAAMIAVAAREDPTMALTRIDAVAALVAIDMQRGVAAMPCAHPVSDIAARIARLAQAFRAHQLPVILVNVAGRAPGRTDLQPTFSPPPGWTELLPELDRQAGDDTLTKQQPGAFYGTALEQILRRRGATQLMLTGIATSIGVEATARAAYDHGYNVVLVVDAMTDRSAEAHRHSVEVTFPRIGETTTSDTLMARLAEQRRAPAG